MLPTRGPKPKRDDLASKGGARAFYLSLEEKLRAYGAGGENADAKISELERSPDGGKWKLKVLTLAKKQSREGRRFV